MLTDLSHISATTLGTSFELSASAACDELVGLKVARAEPNRRDIRLLVGPKTQIFKNKL